jgi:hypothetical protein
LTSAPVSAGPHVVSQRIVTMSYVPLTWGSWNDRSEGAAMVTSDSHGRCTVPVHVAATVAWRLPGALMGVILFVVAGSVFGPPGVLLAAIWLVTGLLTGFRFGERALIRTVLRYRPAPTSWLEAEVRRLLPGRRVDVYVAPKATGVFALGGHTIGLGEASVGAGDPTPGLLAATAAAAEQLRAGRTRPELPLLWWCLPWWFAKKIPGRLPPRRWQPLVKLWATCEVAAAMAGGVQTGHPSVIVVTGLAITDLCITAVRGRRQRRPVHRRLQPAGPVAAPAMPVAAQPA